MNSLDNILAKLPTDTKIVRFITKEGTTEDSVVDNELNITGVEVTDLSSVALPNLVACNVILNCFLACFGVDVASIARSNVDIGDYRLVDMQNLLINSKWDTTNMTIGGVTKTAYEWVKYRFHIYSKENFINQLYNRINDTCLKGKVTDGDSIISVDSDTYQMIKFIAMCFGTNVGFSSIPLGSTETANITFNGNMKDLFEKVGETLEKGGYIADKSQMNWNQDIWRQWTNGESGWETAEPETSWTNVMLLIFKQPYSHMQISTLTQSYVDPETDGKPSWGFTMIFTNPVNYPYIGNITQIGGDTFGEVPYLFKTSDLVTRNLDAPTFVSYGGNGIGCPILRFWDENGNIMTLSYRNLTKMKMWSYGTTKRLMDGVASVGVSSPTYDVTIRLGDHYNFNTNSSDENSPLAYLPILVNEWNYNIANHLENRLVLENFILNNEGTVESATVPEPTVDHTILDDIDDIDMISSGWFKRITLGIEGLREALRTRSNFYDTTVSLKTDMIKTSTYRSIRTGVPLYNAKEDVDLNYITKFSSAVPYSNNAQKYQLNLSQRTYVLSEVGEINAFNSFLWDKDFADKIIESLTKYSPLDCISDAISLPFDIKEEDMSEQQVLSCGGFAMSLPNAEAKGKALINYIRVLRTEPIPVGLESVAVEGENNAWIPDSYLNYEPYTTATIYIPFIGERKLDMSLIMYKWLYLEYKVFVPTGDFIVSVYAYDSNDLVKYGNMSEAGVIGVEGKMGAYPVITAQGNMAYHHRLAGSSQSDGFKALTSGISMVAGAFVGNPMGTLMSGTNAANSMSGINHMQTSGSSFGNMTALLANWNAYITIFKHEAIRGYTTDTNTAFNQTIGKKSERGVKIKHMGKGFHKVKGVRLEGINAPSECKEELIRILEDGFYKASDPDGTIGSDD